MIYIPIGKALRTVKAWDNRRLEETCGQCCFYNAGHPDDSICDMMACKPFDGYYYEIVEFKE